MKKLLCTPDPHGSTQLRVSFHPMFQAEWKPWSDSPRLLRVCRILWIDSVFLRCRLWCTPVNLQTIDWTACWTHSSSSGGDMNWTSIQWSCTPIACISLLKAIPMGWSCPSCQNEFIHWVDDLLYTRLIVCQRHRILREDEDRVVFRLALVPVLYLTRKVDEAYYSDENLKLESRRGCQ